MIVSYPLLNQAEKLIADARRTTEQSRKLVNTTVKQIELSHKLLSESFSKPHVLQNYIRLVIKDAAQGN